jgi:hypothetical protein
MLKDEIGKKISIYKICKNKKIIIKRMRIKSDRKKKIKKDEIVK